MAFLTDTLARAAFKRTLGKAHTSNAKELANEAESSFITIAARDIFADHIANIPAAAITAGISSSLVSLTLTLDPSSNGKAYFASITTVSGSPLQGKVNPKTGLVYANSDRVGFLIPPQYGQLFRATLKNNGSEVAPSSAEDWFVDYIAGIITSEDDLNLINGTLEAYVYTGRYLDSVVITNDGLPSIIDSYAVFAKAPGGTDGYSLVSGNVGIGTTTPAEKLTISTVGTGGIIISNASSNDPVLRLQFGNTDIFTLGVDNSDADRFKIERGGALGLNNDFIINSTDGSIGIGTSNPQQKMQINGNLRFSPNNATIISETNLAIGSQTTLLVVSDTDSTVGAPASDIIFGAGSGSALSNASYASQFPASVPRLEYMRVKGSSGLVGIGTTNPTDKLTVSGGNISVINGHLQVTSDDQFIGMDSQNSVFWNNTTGNVVFNFKKSASINIDSNNDDSDNQAIYIGKNQATFSSSNNLVTILESGNVGIGTTTPAFPLQVIQNINNNTTSEVKNTTIGTAAYAQFSATVSTGSIEMQAINSGYSTSGVTIANSGRLHSSSGLTGGMVIDTDAAAPLIFGTSNIERARIDSTGKVGIGTTIPQTTLDIYNGSDSATQTAFTQSISTAGLMITSDFVIGNFTPGLFWSTQNNNSGKPKTGIYPKLTSNGSYLYFGTSSNFATGITNDGLVIRYDGNVGIGTSEPGQQLEIVGINSAPGTSGSAEDGIARFHPTGSTAVVDIGMLTSPAAAWIQPRDNNNYANNWPLALNPNGGNVGIKTMTPGNALTIAVDGSAGTPALSLGATADSDTGIFHPAAGVLALSADAVEIMRWSSTQARVSRDGTLSNVALSFGATSDPNTGIYHPGANTIGIVGGGNELLRINGNFTGPYVTAGAFASEASQTGAFAVKDHTGYDRSEWVVSTAAITTTTDTVTVLRTIAMDSSSTYIFEAMVVARTSTDNAHYAFIRRACYFRSGSGAPTLAGSIQSNFTAASGIVGLDVTFAISGNSIQITVDPGSADTHYWVGSIQYMKVTSDV